jgi:hypothetical protein
MSIRLWCTSIANMKWYRQYSVWITLETWVIHVDNCFRVGSRCSSGSIVSDYGLDDRAIGVRSPAGQRIFPLTSVSRPAPSPTQPPVQWVPGVLSSGQSAVGALTLTTHPHLVPRSRMSRSYTSSPPCATMACSGTALFLCIGHRIDSVRYFCPPVSCMELADGCGGNSDEFASGSYVTAFMSSDGTDRFLSNTPYRTQT